MLRFSLPFPSIRPLLLLFLDGFLQLSGLRPFGLCSLLIYVTELALFGRLALCFVHLPSDLFFVIALWFLGDEATTAGGGLIELVLGSPDLFCDCGGRHISFSLLLLSMAVVLVATIILV